MEKNVNEEAMEPNKQPSVTIDEVDGKGRLYKWEIDYKVAAKEVIKLFENQTKDKDALIAQLREGNTILHEKLQNWINSHVKLHTELEQLQQENQRLKEQLNQLEQAHKEEVVSIIKTLRDL